MAFEPSRLASFDRETLLAEIKRVLRQFGSERAPTHEEFNHFSCVHSATIAKQFGTWEAAMRAAGVDYARSRLSSSDLEGDLRKVLEASGGTYFTQEFYVQAGGRYNTTTLKKRLHCAASNATLESLTPSRIPAASKPDVHREFDFFCGCKVRPTSLYASIFFTTLPSTSVSRKSRPMWWTVRRV